MSTQERPPKSSDGLSGSPDNTPEGVLPTTYTINIVVSAHLLREMEKLAWRLGLNRQEFDHQIFTKGLDTLTTHARCINEEEWVKTYESLGRLSALARKKTPEW